MNSADCADADYRVLILPPTRRDGEVTCGVLERTGLTCTVCDDAADLAARVVAGAGAVILTDASTKDRNVNRIIDALSQQPSWSDVPIILLSKTDVQSAATSRWAGILTNVTVLDRPTSTRTLVSSVQAAIRSRHRQYEIRDQLQALRQADDASRSADRRKDEFLAMLAHELRNPLAPIITAAELLARQLPQESRSQAAVGIVKRQVSHLTRLVDDLLDVSRITQGRIQLQRQPLEVAAIVSQAIESVEPLLRSRGHELIVSSPGALFVEGDGARLVQCVTNLLTNAAKYTDPCGQIRVGIREQQSAVVISVADDGIGISAELLPRIFDLFVQSDRSLDRSEGGLGIGLSVVQRLVDMHGGRVTAASAGPHRGSTFEIWLPLIAVAANAAEKCAHTAAKPKRVLVVDDNEDAASSLAEVLRLDGHVVEAVYSARQALQCMATFGPEVVLLDIGLPEMDGYQVARKIRAMGGAVRLIALTGYGQAEDKVRTTSAGFDAHVVKPVDFASLERLISGTDAGSLQPGREAEAASR
jgi:signal transduction histidine kinase/ActR/RegA family two-component response regulator